MKLTQTQLKKIVDELDFDFEVETEHRKGSTFYASGSYEITQEDIKDIAEATNIDANELQSLIGTYIDTSGVWDDDNGCDWYEYSQSRKVIVTIPEQIIPEHTVVQMQSF